MKTTTFWHWLMPIFVLGFVFSFAFTATAQNYYPAHIGNEWVLESTNGKERRTYTLEKPEDAADEEFILLKIETKQIDTGDIVDTDKYFLTVDDEAIKLHKTALEQAPFGIVTADFPTPATFFPVVLVQGGKWQIVADIKLSGSTTTAESTTNLEIVGFEDIVTPAGTFQNCAKIELNVKTSLLDGLINIDTTSYQWLAPDLGPVKYETSEGMIFEITNFKMFGSPVKQAQNPPVWQLPSHVFQVPGSRLGGILNVKILENVEDFASEVGNLGIESVTGDIVLPGEGTGFATNSEGKQDLWVAGIFENAPIIGTITLFAENDKGKTRVTIEVTINIR